MHLLHRYSHIPSTLVLNKIDLIPCKSDLLRLADILTEGTINGIQVQRSDVGFGKFDKHFIGKKSIKKTDDIVSIHPTSSYVQKRNEEWHALYKY